MYCRCRAFPAVITFSDTFDKTVENHLKDILDQVDKTPGRFGIGEAGAAVPEDNGTLPNAFHTYWTLEILGR